MFDKPNTKNKDQETNPTNQYTKKVDMIDKTNKNITKRTQKGLLL